MQFLRNKVVAVATAIICTTAVVAAGGATTVGIASANVNRSSVTHMALAQYPYRLAYTVIDPGTFGGPNSYFDGPGVPLTSNGTLVGQADTTTPCPPIGPCEDPYIQHAFTFQNARLTDLGALPGNNSSAIWELNSYGVGVGNSEDGLIDPNTGTEASVAVLFVHGQVIRLGALPGGYESQAQDISDQGQVAGFSSNGIPDPYSSVFLGWKTETRTFVWKNGVMTDIGTLGTPDAIEQVEDQRGQIAGASFTNDTPSPYTGSPTLDRFLWENGHMIDLGTLGLVR